MARKDSHFLKRNWQSISVFLVFSMITVFLLMGLIPRAKPLLTLQKANTTSTINGSIHIVAIGDSLTEGIGDTTNAGGYVPMLATGLKCSYQFGTVETNNYGKSGNRTTQLTKRVEESLEIQENINIADMVIITIGANDLMKVVKANLLKDLSLETFENPKEEYKTNLAALYQTIRSFNTGCPIYILGIYNPFYLNFQEITEMQDIVNMWNDTTKDFIESQSKAYFIPINDQIYQGNGVSTASDSINNLLSEEDSFHPNNIGYQIIANTIRDKIIETQDEWLKEK